MKRKIIGFVIVTLSIGMTILPVTAELKNTSLQITSGLYFYQVDYQWTNTKYTNSNTGLLVVHIDELTTGTGLSLGYINGYTTKGWVVQNLGFFENFAYPQVSRFFDLGQTGECSTINIHIEITEEPYTAFTYSGALTPYPVVTTSYNTEGDEEPVSFTRPQPPPPSVPGENDFDELAHTFFYTQDNHPNVPTAHMQCVPAAYANNLQYLENTYGTPVDDELILGVNGTPPNSLTGQLDVFMERKAESIVTGKGTNYEKGLSGFLKYVFFESLPISVKHQGLKGDEDFTYMDITSKGQGKSISFDFILDEIREGHAVTLLYWHYVAGEHKGGHMVQLVTAGKIMGVPYIEYLDDPVQGTFNAGNTPRHTYLIDFDHDGKLNAVHAPWTSSGPPEVELLVILDAENRPPEKPSMPSGGSFKMKTDVEYEFTTSTTDPNGNQIWYLFDWGDGTTSGWIGHYDSGNTSFATHSWNAAGIYKIKVKARDYYNAESEWSDERLGIFPKCKSYKYILLRFIIQQHSYILPLLR